MFLSFLSVFVFLIPSGSGEKISYTLTMLLAIAVFLTSVGDNLPKTSTFMPVFSYYIIAMLLICALVTLATILNLRLFHSDDSKPIPRCFIRIVMWCSRRAITKHEISQESPEESPDNKDMGPKISEEAILKNNQSPTMQQIWSQRNHQRVNNAKVVKSSDNSFEECTTPKNTTVTWKDTSAAFDILFFLTFLVVSILTTVTYFVVVFRKVHLTIDDLIMSFKVKFNIDV
jgi:hypothetical protein